jgi:hypothetical protein
MLKEQVFYPPHEPRTESKAYAAIHRHLVRELDLPCIACGVRNSTLGDPAKNPAKARAMETHHHVIEWALMNAIDLQKFNERIVALHRAQDPNSPKYNHDFTEQEMKDWVDHDPDNLWVVCDVHHRHELVGIHSITYPIWGPQDLIRPDYVYTPDQATGTPAAQRRPRAGSRQARGTTARATRR